MPPRFLGLTIVLAVLTATFSIPAAAGDRCEGTLCDFYYDHTGAPPPPAPTQGAAAPQAPADKPSDSLLGRLLSAGATQPSTSATAPAAVAAPRKLVAVQGGGVVGMMNGVAPQRCTGTLCDLFYGGPPPEAPAPTEAAVAPATEEAALPSADVRPEETPSESDTRSSCAADTRDPWRCYRR